MANDQYAFTEWSGSLTGKANPVTITMNERKRITANFALTYGVTYSGNGNTGGTPPTDGKAYTQGTEVTVLGANTLVKTGYRFNGWNTAAGGGGTQYAPGATFNMPGADVTLYAQWIAGQFRLSVNSGTGSGEYEAGRIVSIAATPAEEGKAFDVWTGDVAHVANVNLANTHVTMPLRDITVTATYKDKPAEKFTLTVTSGTGSGEYQAGEVVSISAADAPEGKIFDVWSGDTANVENIAEPNTTITIPSADVSVTAVYKDIPDEKFSLTVTGGTGSGAYKAGDIVNIAAGIAPADQIFDVWTGETAFVANINNANTTLKMPDADIAVTATYKDKPAEKFTLTVTSGTGSGQYEAGTVVGIAAAVPADGMIFDVWAGQTGTVANINDPNTTLTMPNAGAAISATYKEQTVEKFALTVNSGTGSGSYPGGQVVSISAEPAPATRIFDKWTGQTGRVANINNPNTSITMPESSVVIKAVYKAEPAIKYTLSVTNGTGSGEYKAGRVVTIAATPAETGFIFDKWTGQTANVANVNIPNITITMPESDVSVTATYKTDPHKDYSLEIRTDTWEAGDGRINAAWKRSGFDQVPAGMLVNLNAPNPPEGYVFDIWAGQTGNVANVNLPNTTLYMPDSDVTVIAAYKPLENPVLLTVTQGTGSGEYDPNTVVNITADDPPAGEMFDKWTGQTGAVENINLAATCIVMPSTNVAIGAVYRDKPVELYALNVTGGSGSGEYEPAEMVEISAGAAPEGWVFDKWVGQIATLENLNSPDTRLYMPPNTVAVTATYTDASAATRVGLTGPLTVREGKVSTAFTLTSLDADGNAANVTGDTVFALTSDSAGTPAFYSDAAGKNVMTQVTILQGTSRSTFYYKDTETGNPSVTASYQSGGTNLGSASHSLKVIAAYAGYVYVSKDGTCGGKTPCYDTIQSAVDAALANYAVRISQGTYEETVTLNQPKDLTLQGGWNENYTAQTVNTTFMNPPLILQGSLTFQMVTLKTDFLYVSKDGACGGLTPCYTIIQEAVDAAGSGNTVRIGKGTFTGSIVLNEAKTVILQGGWNSLFTTQTTGSTFITPPKVVQGSIKLEMVGIKP